MVKIPSVNPHLNNEEIDENPITEFLFEELTKYGFDVKLQEVRSAGNYYKFLPERPEVKRNNVIARFGTSSRKKLVLNGHVDTVSGVNMKDPFKTVVDGGALRGRGSSDMKGGVAAMITAARAVMGSEADIDGTVILTLVVDEEAWGMGTSTFVNSEKVDYAIVCEPTDLKISLSQAGYLDFNLTSRGESRHGSTIVLGMPSSAVLNAVQLCTKIAELPVLREAFSCEGVRMPNTMNLSPIPVPIYPSFAWMSHELYGMNVLLGIAPRKSTKESEYVLDVILGEVMRLVAESNSNGEKNSVEVNQKMHGFTQERNEFVRAIEEAVRGVIGKPTHEHTLSFCDGTFLHDAGTSTVLFGPGRMELGHSSNEYVPTGQVKQATATYADAILKILS